MKCSAFFIMKRLIFIFIALMSLVAARDIMGDMHVSQSEVPCQESLIDCDAASHLVRQEYYNDALSASGLNAVSARQTSQQLTRTPVSTQHSQFKTRVLSLIKERCDITAIHKSYILSDASNGIIPEGTSHYVTFHLRRIII